MSNSFKKKFTVCTTQDHSLVILENPAGSFIGEIPRCQARHSTGRLDHLTYGPRHP